MDGCDRVYDRTPRSALVYKSSLLRCDAVLFGEWFRVLRTNIVPSLSKVKTSMKNTKRG
jgi:hypothetical protein